MRWTAIALVVVACRKEPAPSTPDAALTPEQTLVDIVQRYPDGVLNDGETKPIPAPDDPWAGKVVRVAGRVRTVEASATPIVELEAPTANKQSVVICKLPEGTRPLSLGSNAMLEGTLHVSLRSLPGPGGPVPSFTSRVSFVLGACRALIATPRSFGNTATALGLTVTPLDKLLASSPKVGTRVAFTARAVNINNDWKVIDEDHVVECRGAGMNHNELHRYDHHVAIAALVASAAKDSKEPISFEECQPIDE